MKNLNKNNQFNKNHNYLFQELHDIDTILENILNIFTKLKDLDCNLFNTDYFLILENKRFYDIINIIVKYINETKKVTM